MNEIVMFDWLFGRSENKLLLLEKTSDLFHEVQLDDVVLIACQHLLGTTRNMFEILFKHGLRPENTYLLGKCYSTSDEVYSDFKKRGVHVSPFSKKYDSQVSFDEQFQLHIELFVREVKESGVLDDGRRIIVLDDGGELLLYANDFFKRYKQISGVEQTSSGYHKLKDVKLSFPVINIARSNAKLAIESPMIAETAVMKLEQKLSQRKADELKVLIVGQGSIGTAVTILLSKRFDVETYDISSHGNHFPGSYDEKLHKFDVIVGATGRSIIQPGDFGKLKDGVVLASVSSSDREFSAAYLRRLAGKSSVCHEDITVNGITLLNAGFPINFDGSLHSVAPEKIQLTRALLLAGVFTAASHRGKKDLVSLEPAIEKRLVSAYEKMSGTD